ncbi:MAG: FAD-dependent oxidoreductase [gamma proteobacterium symbiont of Bathyaustriella thionipta]|nr:FAD-dependent oxidoreductase [gamma proteobacterium symbiont of Bathyaustriella thionipta]
MKKFKKPAKFDNNLLVIGAGSGGLVSAYIAAAVQSRVTLIEKHKMGGDCLNSGCVPSKALIHAARFLASTRRAQELGFTSAHADFDFANIMQHVQKVIQQVAPHDSVERYRSLGVHVVEGQARLISPYQVEVNGQIISSRNIIIATGAQPFVPPIPGLQEMDYLTSDNLWDLKKLPARLLVLGGGPIGCELSQCFARFGSKVTIVEIAPRLMIREDEDVVEQLTAQFIQEGIDIKSDHKATAFRREGDKKIMLAEYQGKEVTLEFDEVLVAVGRTANSSGFGLQELGVEISLRRSIEVNPFLQTNYKNIYAVGDVVGPYQFTHTAAHQAWYAAVNALFGHFKKFRVDYSVIPFATFSDPEIARVGLNEQDAKQQQIAYEVTIYHLDDLDRAIADSAARGFVKVLSVPGKDKILGATIVGEHAAELIAEFVSAMKNKTGLNQILSTIHIYPTWNEANKYAAGNWKKAHTRPFVMNFLEKFHRWMR